MKSILIQSSALVLLLVIFISCGNREQRLGKTKNPHNSVPIAINKGLSQPQKISKVTFFIENSGSMLGYVKTANDYINAIVSLSYLPQFDKSKIEFYFINGTSDANKNSNISINLIGQTPEALKNNLNQRNFNMNGNPNYSDLTRIFEKALSCARSGEISILISDCIYDVGADANPLTSLKIETEKTKKVFRDRLANENIQTIIIKAESFFDGLYCYASQPGSIKLYQRRPYYILIFGDSYLLNKNFSETNISSEIAGYLSMARFMKIDKIKVPYQATNQNSKGTFKFDKRDKNKLICCTKDRNGLGFQFSVAVDYSSLPFPDNYYKSKVNYTPPGTYKIVDIYVPAKRISDVNCFHPTHLITLHTSSSPYGYIELVLKYVIPSWIAETNTNTESAIKGDVNHTFGFKYLIDAITEAYQYKNSQQNLASFKFSIQKNN